MSSSLPRSMRIAIFIGAVIVSVLFIVPGGPQPMPAGSRSAGQRQEDLDHLCAPRMVDFFLPLPL